MYENKIFNVMVIFLLWLGLVCCGVANGLIYDHVEAPQNYYYMVSVCFVDLVILVVYCIYTRDWCREDSLHSQVFGFSAFFAAGAFLMCFFLASPDKVSWGTFVGGITMFLSFAFAMVKEGDYV